MFCKECKEHKPTSEFYTSNKRKSGFCSNCKQCQQIRMNQRHQENKEKLVKHFGGVCSNCGYDKNPRILQFHHTNPEEKEFGISSRLSNSFTKLLSEASKCVLLCANCHAEKHLKPVEERRKNYSRKEIENRRQPTKYCKDCNKKIRQQCRRCKTCENKNRCISQKTKINWPSTQELLNLLKTKSYVSLGKELKVSDNAIRKRIKNHPT